MGYFTGTGPGSGIEFQKMLSTERSADFIKSSRYERVNNAYEERDLLARGQDDGTYYDVNQIPRSGSSLNLSEAEQTAESRATVDEVRRS